MSLLSAFALYFIFWWLTLFAVLPFGLKTQGEEGTVVNGTIPSAPAKFEMKRTFMRTTIVATIIYGIYAFLTQYMGYGFDDLPRIIGDHPTGPAA